MNAITRTAAGAALIAALCVTALSIAVPAQATTWTSIETVPDRAPVTVKVEGKERAYFLITPEQPLLVPVTGPARLRVVSRVTIPAGTTGPASYRLRVATAKRVLEEQRTQALPSLDAKLPKSSQRPGESRQMIVTVPKGKHRLTLSVEEASGVLVRLLTSEPAADREATVSLTPIEATRSVSLKEDERLIPYYSILPGKPVRFRVVGPTTLDLITRLDFDPTMRGSQAYRVQVAVGDQPPRVVEYRTTKALTATYPQLPDRVPSKFRRLRLPLAAGLHEVTLALIAPKDGSVEVQARIPAPMVGNAE